MNKVVSVLLLAIVFPAISHAFDMQFNTPVVYDTGDNPRSCSMCDLDRDGYIDLIVLNYDDSNVSIYFNNGDGTFSDCEFLPVGGTPNSVVCRDFDGDGIPDLAIANVLQNMVSILINNGNRTFAPAQYFNTGDHPLRVSSVDLDSDGDEDLVTANGIANSISILHGNGDGTFAPPSVHDIGLNTYAVVCGDFNGDGDQDLAITSRGNYPDYIGSIAILLGNGDGTFAEPVYYEEGTSFESIASGDLNGDGNLDLVVGSDSVRIFVGNGDGSFAPMAETVGRARMDVTIDHFDPDGILDLAVADYVNNRILIHLGNGDATFDLAGSAVVSNSPISIACGDIDCDGDKDLAVACHSSNCVSVLMNNGGGTLVDAEGYFVGSQPSSIDSGDFDSDGVIDLTIANRNSGHVVVQMGKGDGTFMPAVYYLIGEWVTSVACADLDGDGDLDIAATNHRWPNYVSILMGSGDGGFSLTGQYDVGEDPSSVLCMDLDNDGYLDLSVGYLNFKGTYFSTLMNNGDGTFGSPTDFVVGRAPARITGCDLDGDGNRDLVIASRESETFSVLFGLGDGTFKTAIDYGVGDVPTSIKCSDIDADGDCDLAVGKNQGSVSVFLNNGDGSFSAPVEYKTHFGPSDISFNDFDSDGKMDMAVASASDNLVSILPGFGDGSFASPSIHYQAGIGPRSITSGDFDGDGDIDLATQRVTVLLNESLNLTAVMLDSWRCFSNGSGIEVEWNLFESKVDMTYHVFRELLGSDRFMPIQADIEECGSKSFKFIDADIEPALAYRYRVDVSYREITRTLFMTDFICIDAPVLTLGQNFPNPFNPSTTIAFGIEKQADVKLTIFDVSGSLVRTLVRGVKEEGIYHITWNGQNDSGNHVASGIYFYRLVAGDFVQTRKMVLLR